MTKKIILVVVALLAITGTLVGVKVLQFSAMISAGADMAPPPEVVSTAVVKSDSWQPFLRAVGSVTAQQGVMVSAEVPGTVSTLSVDSGLTVQAGSLLVGLDASTERADLRSAEAGLVLARQNLGRARDLRRSNNLPQSELDSAEARFEQAEADVERLRAVIAKKTIRAPFDGRLGIRQVNLGQYLTAGAPIVSLQTLDPVYVDFTLPQQRLSQLEPGLMVEVTTDSFPGQTFTGTIHAIDSDVQVSTRSVRVRAMLRNPDHRLRPGMFTNVAVLLPEADELLVIPATSILFAAYGNSVYVVEEGENGVSQVRQQFVRLGASRGDFVAVAEGLQAGESVVMTGAFKLRNGAAVTIDNELAPELNLSPTPANS
jgi:membrane fusion protein (multidrug efflux system)